MQEQIIVAVFPSRSVLLTALDYLMEDAAADIRRAAVVARTKTGEILVLDDSLGQGEGGIIGGVIGGVTSAVGMAALGALALPALNTLVVTALGLLSGGLLGWFIGQLAARLVRGSFATDVVESLASKLPEERPALMLQARDAARLLPRLRDDLKQAEVVESLLNLR